MLVLYFPPLQAVFRCEALTPYDLFFIVALTSSMLVLDTVRKRYFPGVFTELPPDAYTAFHKGKKITAEKSGAFFV